jgi:hypothetical protein
MTPTSKITTTDRIWETLCQVPSKGRTHSELRRQMSEVPQSTISSILTKFAQRGHIVEVGKRKGDVMMEAVYVADLSVPWITKAERRKAKVDAKAAARRPSVLRKPEPQTSAPQPMPLEVPQAGQGKPRNQDWLEGYTDALLGRPSALSHYSEGYLAGVNARAAR